MTATQQALPQTRATWWREASGAVADLGVLVPIALTLIVVNGLSVTAVLLPAGLAYLMVARVYGIPVSVQPVKAFGAAAIAIGAGPDVIAAGSLLLGAIFLALGLTGLIGRVARWFPLPVIRGVQISVGLTLSMVAWKLVWHPSKAFTLHVEPWLALGLCAALVALLLLRRGSSALLLTLIGLGCAIGWAAWHGVFADVALGPTGLEVPNLSWAALTLAATALVAPQIPLTLANSCVAPADAARAYFPGRGESVTPDRLALTLGGSNLAIGAISGMPICHGAGGMSAHYTFGARTWRAPVLLGSVLVVAALVAAEPLAAVMAAFPVPILAAMLAVAGIAHIGLARDLLSGDRLGRWEGRVSFAIALGIGIAGAAGYLAVALLVGMVAYRMLVTTSTAKAGSA